MLNGNLSVVVEKQLVRVLVGEQDGDDRYARDAEAASAV